MPTSIFFLLPIRVIFIRIHADQSSNSTYFIETTNPLLINAFFKDLTL